MVADFDQKALPRLGKKDFVQLGEIVEKLLE